MVLWAQDVPGSPAPPYELWFAKEYCVTSGWEPGQGETVEHSAWSEVGVATREALAVKDKNGVTLDKASAEHIAHDALEYHAMPPNSTQHSILTFAPAHLVGLVARTRPFMGQLGSCPASPFPDSHNAGDFGSFLVGAPHPSKIEIR